MVILFGTVNTLCLCQDIGWCSAGQGWWAGGMLGGCSRLNCPDELQGRKMVGRVALAAG